MKKNLLALSVAAAVLAGFMGVAQAAVPGSATVGVRGGWVHANLDSSDIYKSDDKNGFGYGIYADYNFLSWLGVEVGYTAFDGMSYKDKADGSGADLSAHGPEIAMRLALPLTDDGSDLFLRAGGFYSFADIDHGDSDDNLVPVVGAGVQWAFTKNFGMRIGYDHYFGAFDGKGSNFGGADSDFGFAYAGVQLTFGGPEEKAPAPAPAPEPVITHVQEAFALDAGLLFPFDGSNISEQGAAAVGDVVNQVNAKNVQNAQYTVKGHTDRLGSDAYNQKLSEKRANAVATELQNHGVPADSIVSVEGLGETSPVTGDKCNGLSRNELIKCLAPDRRVEISVSGDVITTQETVPVAQ